MFNRIITPLKRAITHRAWDDLHATCRCVLHINSSVCGYIILAVVLVAVRISNYWSREAMLSRVDPVTSWHWSQYVASKSVLPWPAICFRSFGPNRMRQTSTDEALRPQWIAALEYQGYLVPLCDCQLARPYFRILRACAIYCYAPTPTLCGVFAEPNPTCHFGEPTVCC